MWLKTKAKIFSFAAVLLLIGVIIAPSAQPFAVRTDHGQKQDVITIEAYGTKDVQSSTVSLTKAQYSSLIQVLAEFQDRLNASKDGREAISLYREVFAYLGSCPFFPRSIDIGRLQGQVLKGVSYDRIEQAAGAKNSNYCCLTSGQLTGEYCFMTPFSLLFTPVLVVQLILLNSIYNKNSMLYRILYGVTNLTLNLIKLSLIINNVLPMSMLNTIDGPASGWVYTIGLTGVKKWSGNLTGILPKVLADCPMAVGFIGLKIVLDQGETHFFIGASLAVGIANIE